jgi:hypothetical protein
MTAVEGNGRSTAPSDPTALRKEIAQTRADLGETVEALAAKVDVKARAHETVEHAKLRARATAQEAKDHAIELGRDFRQDPLGQLRALAERIRRSIRERPMPWAVAAGFVALAALVRARRYHGER